MARRATSLTKGRAAAKKPARAAPPELTEPKTSRRGAKSAPREESPAETSVADALLAGGPGSHIDTSDAEMKPRRSRKSKAQSTLNDSDADSAQTEESEAPAEAVAEPVAKPAAKRAASPRKTGRNREPEASAPPPLETIEPPASVETDAPAAQWHPETDTVTFDWFSIEQVAASDGPNQPMAKLLLAARAEGANSRWPF